MKRIPAALALLFATFCSLMCATVRADTASIPGAVVVAKRSGDAVLLWQTNDAVDALHAQNLDKDALMRQLLAEAVTIMIDRAHEFAGAKTLSVRLLYSKAGGVDKNYGTDTVAGIDKIATVTAPVASLAHNAQAWPQAVRDGKSVPGLSIQINSADATH